MLQDAAHLLHNGQMGRTGHTLCSPHQLTWAPAQCFRIGAFRLLGGGGMWGNNPARKEKTDIDVLGPELPK